MNKFGFFVTLILLTSTICNAQLGIGTGNPDPSAILELNVNSLPSSGKKGFLGPKVALTSSTDVVTIPSPASGLIVYNLGTGGLSHIGYVFWDGTSWRKFENTTTLNGSLGTLNCSGSELLPNGYTAGVPYSGTLKVPYVGGNGGTYLTGSPIPSTGVTGLTATLQAGSLNVGPGELIYTVSGIPSSSSPSLATFSLPSTLGAQSCSVQVGQTKFDSEGSKVYKVKFRGRNTEGAGFPKPTLIAPELNLQFRWAVVGGSNYLQVRLINAPTSNVAVFYVASWSGQTVSGTYNTLTFTPSNFSTYQNIDGNWSGIWGYYYQFATNEVRTGDNNPVNFVANLYGLCGYGNGWGAANEPYSLAIELF